MEILTNVQLLLCPDGDAVSFTGAEQAIAMELVSAEIENHIGIEMLPVEAGLKMEMGGCGTSCTACETNRLPCFDPISWFHQVLGVMTVSCFQAIVMADHDQVAIGGVGLGHPHKAVECSHDCIVGLRLDIHAGMVSASASVG